ncbi:ABC transporter permease [Vibrio sp. HDW18]|uniref:ABC transporter permease n=1 Tax=Vibrio sp. HDW18 TaxID=2714948 RepID=UPI0014097199|nr:ABC transporter permease [Vibrio sp. HDW18]QIL86411.1 ABC transporter permease [Vibrio sp. HDW18]
MLWPVVKALLGHYRRYPLQIFLVWLGLTLGVSLLVGVTAINHHARQSYEHGERLFANPLPYRIRSKLIANKIPQGFYIQLRRDGFEQCVPFDDYRISTRAGLDIMLQGVDPVALLSLDSGKTLNQQTGLRLMQPPYPVMVSQELAKLQGWQEGDHIALEDDSSLGPITIDAHNQVSGMRVIADLSLVRRLKKGSGLTVIACADMPPAKLDRLKQNLPNGLTLTRSTRSELESLTQAFHLNLTAMGMLAFLVGIFIFYQAMSLSMVQRQPLVGMLRQLGVSGWQLMQAMLVELLLLVLLCWLCGNVFGLLLANQLIPAVASSLGYLYNANIDLAIAWNWSWSSYSLLMALFAAVASCAWPLVRLLRSQPIRLSARLSLVRFAGKEFKLQALLACVLVMVAIALYHVAQTQQSGFTIIGLILLSVALITPYLIWTLFTSFSYTLRWVKVRWFFADAAASMSYRGVATMAFMVALAANIGVETMVGSFRDTTDRWLSQRLAADLYLYPSNSVSALMSDWLEIQPEVNSVWQRWQKDFTSQHDSVQIVSTGPSEGELDSLTVKLGVMNYWYHLHHSRGVMVSESMALKLGIRPGDSLDLPEPIGANWTVLGVYYDYGNPYYQVMVSHQNWINAFAGSGNVVLAVVLNEGVTGEGAAGERIKQRLNAIFRLSADRVVDNIHLHSHAMRVFDRTFSIASTLGNITLLIAVCGIFFSTLAGETSRLRHISLLRCLGVSGKELVLIGGMQLLVFGAISFLIALPLGLTLAHLVIDLVIKPSFGWTMPLQIVPGEYLHTIGWAMVALMLAGALPVIRLARKSPMKSLREAL